MRTKDKGNRRNRNREELSLGERERERKESLPVLCIYCIPEKLSTNREEKTHTHEKRNVSISGNAVRERGEGERRRSVQRNYILTAIKQLLYS